MGANYSFYVKAIATFALTFFGYIISFLASVEMVFFRVVRDFEYYDRGNNEFTNVYQYGHKWLK